MTMTKGMVPMTYFLESDYLKAIIDRLDERVSRLEAGPPSKWDCLANLDNGTVIRFEKSYVGSKPYTYVAIKTGGRWYLSGGKPNAHTHSEIVKFLDGVSIATILVSGKVIHDTDH